MRIAIASGKGGTGKTTVATHLASIAMEVGLRTAYLDCDTEAPNGHLFLHPVIHGVQKVSRMIPKVDEARCTGCGLCGELCQFNGIALLGDHAVVFPDLCHSCGGCRWVCPSQAISEYAHDIGVVESGMCGELQFVQGRLAVGEASSPPLIKAVKKAAPSVDLAILDAPPGTACPMVVTVFENDFVILVTEPTPFGLHDLHLAIQVLKALKLRGGVVINRAQGDMQESRDLCEKAQMPILAEIPDMMAVAEAYSKGQLAIEKVPALRGIFARLLLSLLPMMGSSNLPKTIQARLEQIVKASSGHAPAGDMHSRVAAPCDREAHVFEP